MRGDARKRLHDEPEIDLAAEVARLTHILNELGFCPNDGDTMPCLTCGAGL